MEPRVVVVEVELGGDYTGSDGQSAASLLGEQHDVAEQRGWELVWESVAVELE